jgi:sugar lactone lactonase YvrE
MTGTSDAIVRSLTEREAQTGLPLAPRLRCGFIGVPGPRLRFGFVVAAALLGVVVGCASPAGELLTLARTPVVWPKDPDPPRVRLLGEIASQTELRRKKSFGESFNELLFGREESRRLMNPYAVAVHSDGNRVAVTDTNGGCVHLFDLATQTYSWWDACASATDRLECPVGVAWAGETLCVADSQRHALAIFDAQDKGRWIGSDVLKRPAGVAYCPKNDLLYVSDAAANAIVAFERGGRLVFQFGTRGAGPGQFNVPSQLACGPDGTLVVADSLNFRVQRFALDGAFVGAFGRKGDAAGDLALPKGVAIDADGDLWVVDAQFENVQGFTPDGKLLLAFGQEGQRPGEFWLPAGICIDARRRMWIADSYNRRVQVFEMISPAATAPAPM